MKRINFQLFIAAHKLILICVIFAGSSLITFAQLRPDECIVNGQIVGCKPKPQPQYKCAEGGPLIIKLNNATNFYERSIGYSNLNDNLKCRGLNIGFFGAASDVTLGFHVDENFVSRFTGGFPDISDNFLSLASNELVALNSVYFKEIIDTGKLSVIDSRGWVSYLTNPVAIDSELVRREQVHVENLGRIQTEPNRLAIVSGINARIKWNLDNRRLNPTVLSPTIRAINQVRNNMRVFYPRAEYDYGNIIHRMAVGEILAARHRN